MLNTSLSRRRWLAGTGAASLLTRLEWMNAFAQSTTPDYKALVCIFLAGGNDGHNTVVPLTQAQFNAYKAARGSLALPDGNTGPFLQVSTPDGTPYGLNSGLAAIHPLWAQGKFAVLANTGMLMQPVTRTQFLANNVPLPTNLFSHADQAQQMQSGIASTSGGTGWGGRAADLVQPLNGASSFPAALSMSGPSLFCTGSVIRSASLFPGFNLTASGMQIWPQNAADARVAGLQQVLQFDNGMVLVQAANQARKDAASLNQMLAGTATTVNTPFPGTNLGNQLKQVAQIIKIRSAIGLRRQVFLCTIGGFDTHSAQSWNHWDLLKQTSEALLAFYNATTELGVADGVTSFTLTDFGRSLQPSGTGSDHGWGNHHLILGGAVQGGKMYGTFPAPALGGPDDCGTRGTLIPTTSTDQYGATLANWFGVPGNQLTSVFPNLGKFANPNLGFLG